MKIRILIIEDEALQAQSLKEALEERGFEVTAVANNLKDALGYYYAQKPDIVIVDVYLNGKPDGIVFAQRINENQFTLKPFAFLTSSLDRKTFELARITNPYCYLIKPINVLELEFTIELAIEKFMGVQGIFSGAQSRAIMMDGFFLIKRKDTLVKVSFNCIECIYVEGKYTSIITKDESFLTEISLKQIQQQLPDKQFVQIHRNHMVNLNVIKRIHISDNHIELLSGKTVLMSRRFKEKIGMHYSILK
ncbi:response regulator transcription factor [Flavobacterium nitrogenifigens]|uniref:LytR/AlgR family response regulator transcription factor n=2 Tax=Flavobacterium nitrogenifigens TaxID=1617283 RepID=UPI0031A5D033